MAVDGADALSRAQDATVKLFRSGGYLGTSTGLKALDRAILGLRGEKMYVVAGRPGMGKTALSDGMVASVLSQGLGVIQFSLEMGAEELCQRTIARTTGVPLRRIVSGKMSAQEAQVVESMERMRGGIWWIEDRKFTLDGIRTTAHRIHKHMEGTGIRLGLVVIDYIQLVGHKGAGNRTQEVGAVSRGCKMLSMELGCAVMALSQLNRGCEYRDNKRPVIADLRESGDIEQDADAIIFVYRDVMYNRSAPPNEAELDVAKQRGGPIGTVMVDWHPQTAHFSDVVEAENVGEQGDSAVDDGPAADVSGNGDTRTGS